MKTSRLRLLSGILAVIWIVTIFALSQQPKLPGFALLDLIPWGDKLVHALAFGFLAFLLYGSSQRYWVALALTSLYGLSDEIHQHFVAGRSADFWDWFADTLGAFLVLFAMHFFQQKYNFSNKDRGTKANVK